MCGSLGHDAKICFQTFYAFSPEFSLLMLRQFIAVKICTVA